MTWEIVAGVIALLLMIGEFIRRRWGAEAQQAKVRAQDDEKVHQGTLEGQDKAQADGKAHDLQDQAEAAWRRKE